MNRNNTNDSFAMNIEKWVISVSLISDHNNRKISLKDETNGEIGRKKNRRNEEKNDKKKKMEINEEKTE